MMNSNDGGPAFPLPLGSQTTQGNEGMSLRDYFAGQALAGMCANEIDGCRSFQECAEYAYKHADAMIVARGINDIPQ